MNRYSKVRKSFGQPISSLYAIQEKIAGMSVRVDASRLLIYKAAMLKDAGKPFIKDAAQAKLYASEAATWCSHQAIQVRVCIFLRAVLWYAVRLKRGSYVSLCSCTGLVSHTL